MVASSASIIISQIFSFKGGVLEPQRNALRQSDSLQRNTQQQKPRSDDRHDDLPEALKDFDKALVQKIESDILVHGQAVSFDDISGLEFAKKCVQELICWYGYLCPFYAACLLGQFLINFF